MRSIAYFFPFLPKALLVLLAFNPVFMANATMLSESTPCLLTQEENNYFLTLPFADFDQSALGWRIIADKKCYLLGAETIMEYIALHPKLEPWQRATLYFHAGQLYAFDDRNTAAVHVMRKAHWETPANLPIHWNAYVDATIAFLNKNKFALKRNREIMAKPIQGGIDPNLAIVDRMLKYFYKPYAYVYLKDR